MVRQRSAKPLFAGSIPAVASNFSLPLPSHFSLSSTVESHGWYCLAPFRWSPEEGVLRRPEAVEGEVYDLEVSVRNRRLSVTALQSASRERSQPGTADRVAALQPILERRVRRMLQLDVDIAEFIRLAAGSPAHAWVASRRFGRLLCGTTLFEDIVKIIATTNTMWSQTIRMVNLLVAKCGRPSPLGFMAFPEPQEIARFSADELKRDCRLGYRAVAVHRLAEAVASRAIELDVISDPARPTDGLFAAYGTLPGIGPYGAAHLLAMDGRHDFVAVDTEFRRFVRERHYRGRRVSDAAMVRRYAKWGRWKYLAYWSELRSSVAGQLQPEGAGD